MFFPELGAVDKVLCPDDGSVEVNDDEHEADLVRLSALVNRQAGVIGGD